MTLKKQLIIALLAVGLIPFMIMGITSYISGSDAVENEAVGKLEVARELKKEQIETYLQMLDGQMDLISENRLVHEITDELFAEAKKYKVSETGRFDILDRSDVKTTFREHDGYFNDFIKEQNLYDIFIIDIKTGHVMYTATKESDLGENLKTGSLRDSGLGRAFKNAAASNGMAFADMAPYAPSGGEPAMFMAIPFGEEGKPPEGVVAVQLSIDKINSIMQSRTGMGETGETLLVGPDHLMRSDSLHDKINHSVKGSFKNPSLGALKTQDVVSALSGKVATEHVLDFEGEVVISSYTTVDVFGTKWALIAKADEAEVFAPIYNMRNIAVILGLIFLGIIIGLAMFLGTRISKPIINAVEKISDANAQVVSASDQIAASATSLAEGSSSQASSVEEVSATVEESTAINTQNAENAKEADILAKDANTAATRGNDKVQNLMKSMSHISSSSEQIAKIIKTIDEIAFQTNLLALNAAVEAARAGEHGLGFAVVADEVKNLAGRSAQAAKETETIIQSSIEQIRTGNEIANETNEAFGEILDKIKKTSNLIGEIAISAKEQAEGMNQIAQAMGTVDEVTQQNAATSEEAAAAAEELNAQANAMLESVAEIGNMVGVHVTVEHHQHETTKKIAAPAKRIEAPAKKAEQKKAPQKPKKNDEVFPLDDSDLKEF